jgi:hypothetical protein
MMVLANRAPSLSARLGNYTKLYKFPNAVRRLSLTRSEAQSKVLLEEGKLASTSPKS